MTDKDFAEAVSNAEAQLQEALAYNHRAVPLYVQQLINVLELYKAELAKRPKQSS